MTALLQGRCQAVMEAHDKDSFREEVVRFTKQLGFDTVAAVTVVDHPLGDTEFISVHNAPEGFAETISDNSVGRIDPVMQHCKHRTVPIIWDQGTYLAAEQMPLWESQAQFGFSTGICLALHMPEGRHFMIGVDRDQALPKNAAEITRMVAELQLFAVHAQDTAMRVLVPEKLQPERPKLSPRELDALHWTMEGKTAWEVGAILNISERTAVQHINNAMQKLDCASKHQAVLKALRLGLLR